MFLKKIVIIRIISNLIFFAKLGAVPATREAGRDSR